MKERTSGQHYVPLEEFRWQHLFVSTRHPDYIAGERHAVSYFSSRWNGKDTRAQPPHDQDYGGIPHDGRTTKDMVREGDRFLSEYIEGPRDKAFMEAQDRKYLTELARTNPALFLKEMTPRSELSREDQAKELGLNLRSPHHQNLQREFAALVERIRNPGKERERVAKDAAAEAALQERIKLATEKAVRDALDAREKAHPTPPPLPSAASGGGGGGSGGSGGSGSHTETHHAGLRVLSAEQVRVGERIGGGGFGDVYTALFEGDEVAVKKIRVTNEEATRAAFFNEAEIMARLTSPRIVRLFAIYSDPANLFLVMEYMAKGSLYQLIHSDETMPWSQRFKLAKDVAAGLIFLHSQSIVHRDLKSANILLNDKSRACLADFGLAKIKEEGSKSKGYQIGTVQWTAPEIFEEMPATTASDVYSYAVILWELATRRTPLEDATPASLPFKVMSNRKGEAEKIPTETPIAFSRLILRCWALEPTARPKMTEVHESLGVIEETCLRDEAPATAPPGPKTAIMMGIARDVEGIAAAQRAGAMAGAADYGTHAPGCDPSR